MFVAMGESNHEQFVILDTWVQQLKLYVCDININLLLKKNYCFYFRGDDVEKSLQLLDKVLSEFEDPESLPPLVEPDSPSQGNQSEDDGYMSMNGRR